MAARKPLVQNAGATQQLQSSDALEAPVYDGQLATQPTRQTISGTDRVTIYGAGRQQVYDPATPPEAALSIGSFALHAGEFALQLNRLNLNGNQRATATEDGRIITFNLTPGGRLVLSGSGSLAQ